MVGQVVGDEAEGGQAEGAFEDLVVDRDEANLRGEVGGRGQQLFVRLHEGDVEDLTERV